MPYQTHNPFTVQVILTIRDMARKSTKVIFPLPLFFDNHLGVLHTISFADCSLSRLSTQRIAHTMGIGGGGTLLYRSPELNLRQLHAILTARASRPGATQPVKVRGGE